MSCGSKFLISAYVCTRLGDYEFGHVPLHPLESRSSRLRYMLLEEIYNKYCIKRTTVFKDMFRHASACLCHLQFNRVTNDT